MSMVNSFEFYVKVMENIKIIEGFWVRDLTESHCLL
jgi:hypothetical protein